METHDGPRMEVSRQIEGNVTTVVKTVSFFVILSHSVEVSRHRRPII